MRTTVKIPDSLALAAKQYAAEHDIPFREVVKFVNRQLARLHARSVLEPSDLDSFLQSPPPIRHPFVTALHNLF